ncbi:MAG: hypothetical protein AB7E84_00275 [Xanthobacteraceae bacterium]
MPRSAEIPENLRAIAKTNNGKMVSAIMRAVAPHIKELRDKIAQLESRPTPAWRGAFKQGEVYQPMSFVVDHGSLWIAAATTSSRPGNSSDWVLCCKRGHAR